MKNIKIIEDQGEKQTDALKDLKPTKVINYKSDDDNDKAPTIKEIYVEILEERIY